MTQNWDLILIVDDDQDIRELLKVFLEGDGYGVEVAVDGLDAWEQLNASTQPALILLDLMMPRMDGEQFLKKIRASGFAGIPVIILSGDSSAQTKAAQLKADCCLMKPIELEELLTEVRRYIPLHSKKDVA